jgi:hypothetical protein
VRPTEPGPTSQTQMPLCPRADAMRRAAQPGLADSEGRPAGAGPECAVAERRGEALAPRCAGLGAAAEGCAGELFVDIHGGMTVTVRVECAALGGQLLAARR